MADIALSNSISSKNEDQFPFLELPGELRNSIYGILLTNTTKVKTGAYRGQDHRKTPLSISTSILRVSKQTNSEATPLLYSLNRFQAHPSLLNRMPFLADSSRPVLSVARCSLIRRFHIAVRLDCDPRWNSDDLSKAFSGVNELEIEAWQPSFGMCDHSALLAFASIRGVRKARVHGCGLSPEFARWLESTMESREGEEAVPWDLVEWNVWDNGNR